MQKSPQSLTRTFLLRQYSNCYRGRVGERYFMPGGNDPMFLRSSLTLQSCCILGIFFKCLMNSTEQQIYRQ